MINYQAQHDKTQFYIFLTKYAAGIKWYDIVMESPNLFGRREIGEAYKLQQDEQRIKNFMNKKAAHY